MMVVNGESERVVRKRKIKPQGRFSEQQELEGAYALAEYHKPDHADLYRNVKDFETLD